MILIWDGKFDDRIVDLEWKDGINAGRVLFLGFSSEF